MTKNKTISFILCAQNYHPFMEQTLFGITHQFVEGDEILLMVDKEHIQTYPQDFLVKINKIVEHKLLGLGAIRKKSAQVAECEFIAFVDDDTLLDVTWRESMFLGLKHANTVFTQPLRLQTQTMFEMESLRPFIYYFDTAGCLIERKAILEIGNFDAKMLRAEDSDLASRLVYSGYDAAVSHFCITEADPKERFKMRTFLEGSRSDALLYLKSGLVLNIKSWLGIIPLLLKMGIPLFSMRIWFKFLTFYWIYKNKTHIDKYKLASRKHDVLIVSGSQVFRVQADVRLIFSPSEIKMIKINHDKISGVRNIKQDEMTIEEKGECRLFKFKKDEAALIELLLTSKMITPLLKN